MDFRKGLVHLGNHLFSPFFFVHCCSNDAHILLHLVNGPGAVDDHHRNAQVPVEIQFFAVGIGGGHDEVRLCFRHHFHGKTGKGDGEGNVFRFIGNIGNIGVPVCFGGGHQFVRRHHGKEHGVDGSGISQNPLRLGRNYHFFPCGIGDGIALSFSGRGHLLHAAAGKGQKNEKTGA